MTNIEVTCKAATYISKVIENAEEEKSLIADALSTTVENMQGRTDNEDYMNVCSVLGRYNRLISLLTNG